MARHRNVRTMDLDEEYEGYYSCYGHSVEDDFSISPRTETQFLYDRNAQRQNVSSFLRTQSTSEAECSTENSPVHSHYSSFSGNYPNFSEADQAKLQSCIEAMQDVVGDTISEIALRKAAISNSFDLERALNAVLCGLYVNPCENKHTGNSVQGQSINESLQDKTDILNNRNICVKMPFISSDENRYSCFDSNFAVAVSRNDKEDRLLSGDKKNNDSQIKSISDKEKCNFVEMSNRCKEDAFCVQQEIISNIKKHDEIDAESLNFYTKFNTRLDNVLHLYEKERMKCDKPLLNLVVIGHVDAGKSTLMGHVLYSLGFVPKKAMHKYEQESKKLGKASFMYAWVLDETSEERNRGITMDVAQSKFETPHRIINLLDAPGHKDFIPNMIAGAAQADVAVLVVDATCGEFETGFEAGGQTREHTMLIRSLGVSQLAIVVNKMDNVNWEKKRYDDILNKLAIFLKQVGFKEKEVQFIPCSGLGGENLTKPLDVADDLKKWYSGPTLVDIIDSFEAPERAVDKPLRMCVSDIFKGVGSGFCVSGKIDCGCVQTGDKVIIMPAGEQAAVRGIFIGEAAVPHSFAGDHVILQLTSIDIANLNSGSIICDINLPVKVTSRFQARLVIFNIKIPITRGFPVVLHYLSLTEPAIIKKLISQLHRGTGELLKKHPRCLAKNSSAVVEIEVLRPICVELYREFKDLGRFMLRSGSATIAAGLVTEII